MGRAVVSASSAGSPRVAGKGQKRSFGAYPCFLKISRTRVHPGRPPRPTAGQRGRTSASRAPQTEQTTLMSSRMDASPHRDFATSKATSARWPHPRRCRRSGARRSPTESARRFAAFGHCGSRLTGRDHYPLLRLEDKPHPAAEVRPFALDNAAGRFQLADIADVILDRPSPHRPQESQRVNLWHHRPVLWPTIRRCGLARSLR